MTRSHQDESGRFTGTSQPLAHGHTRSSTSTRWGPWLFSLLIAVGAVVTATINGSGGAATQVPAVIQVGSQSTKVPSSVTTVPSKSVAATTTTIPRVQPLTTVVHPLSTVTEHEDSSSRAHSGETTTGATSSNIASSSADN